MPKLNNKNDIFSCTEYERVTVVFLLTAIVSLAVLYGYLIADSTVNVVVRKGLEQRIAEVRTDISELESRYIRRNNAIDKTYAQENGFISVSKHYVTRTPLARGDSQ